MHVCTFGLRRPKAPAKFLSSLLAGATVGLAAAGVVGLAQPASAATKTFNQFFRLPATGESFNLTIETADTPTTITKPLFTALATCEPVTSGDCIGISVTAGQLQSPGYKFKGYPVIKITGTATEGGVTYDILGLGKASTSGVFNYPTDGNPGPTVNADSIPHSSPDQLFNPTGAGWGFDPVAFNFGTPAAFTAFPATALDNLFSFGGITFDIGNFSVPGDESSFVFKEPYQLFTVAYDSTSTTTGDSLNAGDYAGCPGSCKGAVPVPGPLPIVGLGSALAFSRKLRKRVNINKLAARLGFVD
jgi:hypothetical protein